jgi:predicted DNA-binding transcriptional regulator AlpA
MCVQHAPDVSRGVPLMASMRVEVVPRRCLSRQEAARYVGISVTLFDDLVAERAMPQPFSIRSRRLWDIKALDAAIDAAADQAAHSSKWRDVAV